MTWMDDKQLSTIPISAIAILSLFSIGDFQLTNGKSKFAAPESTFGFTKMNSL